MPRYYFNLPTFNELTKEQKIAVDRPEAISLTGAPGTGKSVVAIWRHLRNYSENIRNSILLTYTKSLHYYIRMSIESKYREEKDLTKKSLIEKAKDNVDRILLWKSKTFDEIIIDEAQDIPIQQIQDYTNFSNIISYTADNNQILYPNRSSSVNELQQLLNNNFDCPLQYNFRNTIEIINFVKTALPDFDFPPNFLQNMKKNGPKPIIKKLQNINQQFDSIFQIIDDFIDDLGTHNIAILLPTGDMVDYFHNNIQIRYPNATKYHSNLEFQSFNNIHITTFKSSKGLEFDTVIIPNFQSKEVYKQTILVNGKSLITDKDYYVAFTRARRNLFLICSWNCNNLMPNNGTYIIEDFVN